MFADDGDGVDRSQGKVSCYVGSSRIGLPGPFADGVPHGPVARAWVRNEKWGPALLPAPICAERRICRCSSAFETRRSPAPRSLLTSSGVASARGSQSEDGFLLLPRPFLDQFPFASPVSRRTPRFAQERMALPAPLPTGPNESRSFHSSPAGGDRTFHPVLILPVVADAWGRQRLSSRSPIPYGLQGESLQMNSTDDRLWIMGISRISRAVDHPSPYAGCALFPGATATAKESEKWVSRSG